MTKLHIKMKLKKKRPRAKVLCLGLAIAIMAGCQGELPDDLVEEDIASGIIFVKSTEERSLVSMSRDDLPAGTNLYSLVPASPDGKLTNLTNLTEGAARGPSITYDGLKVLFSMRPNRNSYWHIYEMPVTGGTPTQLTFGPYNDHEPAQLANGDVVFTSDRENFNDEYERRPVSLIHVLKRATGEVVCISNNQSHDLGPIGLNDGRIAYTRWDHHGDINRFPLFFMMPDGRSTFTLYSPHSQPASRLYHANQLVDGSIIAVFSSVVLGDEGRLCIIKDFSNAGEPFEPAQVNVLTPNVSTEGPFETGAFKFPVGTADGRILASYSPRYGTWEDSMEVVIEDVEPDFGLYTMNQDGSNFTLLYNDTATQEYDAVLIGPKPVPPVIKSQIDESQTTGVFTVEDVYFRQTNDGHDVARREIQEAKRVMVIEGLRMQPGDFMEIGLTNFERKRILGFAPINPDGSFSIEVPADTPISFVVQDSLGRAIVTKRNWVSVRPGERFEKCTGCHGPRGQSSGNPNPIAASLPPTNLNVPVNQREVIDYISVIGPIVEQKCQPCHGDTTTVAADSLLLTSDIYVPTAEEIEEGERNPEREQFTVAYENIMGGSMRDNGKESYVRPAFSRRSRLIDVLLGFDAETGNALHPAAIDTTGQYGLTPDELQKFIQWVDLGAQYR